MVGVLLWAIASPSLAQVPVDQEAQVELLSSLTRLISDERSIEARRKLSCIRDGLRADTL